MARTLVEARISTRKARSVLVSGVHWRALDPDIHLGYRKGNRGGRWLVRWYAGDGHYRQETLGTADDLLIEGTLCFEDACRVARDKVSQQRQREKKRGTCSKITVGDAVASYVASRDARASARAGRPVKSDAHRLIRFLNCDRQLPGRELGKLTEMDLKNWQSRLQSRKTTTKQRTLSDLKAALNACFRDNRRFLPSDFPLIIKFGLKLDGVDWDTAEPVARENQILSDERVRAIIGAAQELDEDGDFALMVMVLAATGARFSQVARMRVGDAQLKECRLFVPTSRKGKGRATSYTKIPIGPDIAAAISKAAAGRDSAETLLQHWRYRQVDSIKWERAYLGPWMSASQMTRKWQAVMTFLGIEGIVPYALRHSSIVRGIRAGLPMRLVAALHDTSVAMIERHYSRWITEGLDELASRAVVPLVPSGDETGRVVIFPAR
jgi:integrase